MLTMTFWEGLCAAAIAVTVHGEICWDILKGVKTVTYYACLFIMAVESLDFLSAGFTQSITPTYDTRYLGRFRRV